LLLDTCTFIWLASRPEELSAPARERLDDPAAELLLSEASIWEICLKWQAGKLRLPAPPRSWIEHQRGEWALERAPIDPEHFYRSTELPEHHRDPFDRLLVAQSVASNVPIVTPDPAIKAYPVAVVW
jgi:PIN domain nuclease of toxin-antitoxin system